MASTSASAMVTDDDLAVAEQKFEDGIECLEADDFVSASHHFAECLELKTTKYGEQHPAVAPVYLKYAASLLGCARLQGDNLLGGLKTKTGQDGASTSAGAGKEATATTDDDSDLALAWEMAELARVVFTADKAGLGDDANSKLAEVHELLADISAERESFEDAIADFEQALKYLDACPDVDIRWQAEIHFKLSIPLELVDRVDDATVHITTALAQLKFLLKQKHAEKEQLQAAEKEGADEAAKVAAVGTVAAPEAAAAGPGNTVEPVTASEDKGDAQNGPVADAPAADGEKADVTAAVEGAGGEEEEEEGEEEEGEEEEEEEEETELEAVERQITELEGVLKDLQERKDELVTAKEQDRAVKEQLKMLLSGGDMGAAAAASDFMPQKTENGTSAAVQDLGVVGGASKKDASDSKATAPSEEKAQSGKRTLEDIMNGQEENRAVKKAAKE